MNADPHSIAVRLDRMLLERRMTLTDLAESVGVTYANLSILKNNHARAIRFSTLTRLCEVLGCQPGDLLQFTGAPPTAESAGDGGRGGPGRS